LYPCLASKISPPAWCCVGGVVIDCLLKISLKVSNGNSCGSHKERWADFIVMTTFLVTIVSSIFYGQKENTTMSITTVVTTFLLMYQLMQRFMNILYLTSYFPNIMRVCLPENQIKPIHIQQDNEPDHHINNANFE
jgi:hypothetical protein